MKAPHFLGLAAACAALAFGCNRTERQIDTQQVRQEARQAAATASDRISDGWLAAKIQAQFFADDDIRARDISVTADEGIVTLSGHIPSENAHTQAIQTANNTDGVNRVIDHLVVGPAAPVTSTGSIPGAVATAGAMVDDARVTSTIQSKYFLDDMVKGRRIDVDTRNGVVTLRGDVQSEPERDRALQLARSTGGVQRVEDALVVKPLATESRSPGLAASAPDMSQAVDDATLTTKIQAKFFLDRDVKAGGINVMSSNGVVTLEGSAPSAAARNRALQIARETSGVKQVIDRIAIAGRR